MKDSSNYLRQMMFPFLILNGCAQIPNLRLEIESLRIIR